MIANDVNTTSLDQSNDDGITESFESMIRDQVTAVSKIMPDSEDQSDDADGSSQLATSILVECRGAGRLSSLDNSLPFLHGALQLCPISHSSRPALMSNFALALILRFYRTGLDWPLDEAIDLLEKASKIGWNGINSKANMAQELGSKREDMFLRSAALYGQSSQLTELALVYVAEFCKAPSESSLNTSISLYHMTIQLHELSDPKRSFLLSNLGDALVLLFFHANEVSSLEEAVSSYQESLVLLPPSHPDRPRVLKKLSAAHLTRFILMGESHDLSECVRFRAHELGYDYEAAQAFDIARYANILLEQLASSGNAEKLTAAVETLQGVLQLLDTAHPKRYKVLGNLANILLMRSHHLQSDVDLQDAISFQEEILKLLPMPHSQRSNALTNLAAALSIRYHRRGVADDLDEAIALRQEALTFFPPPHPTRSVSLKNLIDSLSTRFGCKGQAEDLEQLISLHRDSLMILPASHPDRSDLLFILARFLVSRFQRNGQADDLNEAIALHRDALHLRPAPNPNHSTSLENLTSVLMMRFDHIGLSEDLDEAISLYQQILALHPASHAGRSTLTSSLAGALSTRYEHKGSMDDLESSILLYREAVALRPIPDINRPNSLNNLANALQWRFDQKGTTPDFEEAIMLHREALALRPVPHADRPVSLNNLGSVLFSRFRQMGSVGDLDEAIELHREALTLFSASHPERPTGLNNLAIALSMRFDQKGSVDDLDESISLLRTALDQAPTQLPQRSSFVNNLANALSKRFRRVGLVDDISEAISLHRQTLEMRPTPHPKRPVSLNNLADALFTRFKQTGNADDLNEAISCHWNTLELLPAQHPLRPDSLNNLANALTARFERKFQMDDLDEAILHHQSALRLLPAQHYQRSDVLNNLAGTLFSRFEHSGRVGDLDEAISLQRDAITVLPSFHPSQCGYLAMLASYLFARSSLGLDSGQPDDLDAAMDAYRTAATSEPAPVLDRFRAARMWASYADVNGHASALEAYRTAVGHLPHVAMLASDMHSRREILAEQLRGDTLSSDAAACAIRAGCYEEAVELLEEGRSIIWSQALQLRTPFDELRSVNSPLAQRLLDISSALEQGSLRNARKGVSDDVQMMISTEAEAAQYRHLNEEWLAALREVRKLQGFEGFLLPRKLNALQKAAAHGPVVLLNATRTACHALIVTMDGVKQLPLPSFSSSDVTALVDSIRGAVSNTLASLPHETTVTLQALVKKAQTFRDDAGPLFPQERHLGRQKVHTVVRDPDHVFRDVLATLWTLIVKPVIRSLKLERSESPSRLWWCPAGLFSFLPIHAAGIYDFNLGDLEDISNFAISSYTPTLTSLLVPPPTPSPGLFKMLVAIQPETNGHLSLPSTREELRKIEGHVPVSSLVKLGIPGAPSSVDAVLNHLSDVYIAHFACHGRQDLTYPLESALLLCDGPLKVSRIMSQPMPSASLAFLSACQTAMGDDKLPDEVIHLAATLLFSGFRGVVATMWSIHDQDGPKIADEFYGHLFRDHISGSYPNTMHAAQALHVAVAKLRTELGNKSFSRWVPFIHLGL